MTKIQIDFFKNLWFTNEIEVVLPGINDKIAEIRSALGLLNLKHVNNAIERRRNIALKYRRYMYNIPGITMLVFTCGNTRYIV